MVIMLVLRFIYNLMFCFILLFLLPYQLLKRPKNIRNKWLKERLGFVKLKYDNKKRVWLHAVSVGEAMAAKPLINMLKEEYNIIVTTVTDTGQKVMKDFINHEKVFYAPFDLSFSIKRFFNSIKPEFIIIMETELWPNTFFIAKQKKIPIILVNGRMSESSFKGYKKFRFFMKYILSMGELYCMQTEKDAERFINIGAPRKKVKITGNLKLDIKPFNKDIPKWLELLRKPVIVAGSTHEGEEELILDTFKKLKAIFKELTLVLAPRHPERFSEVEKLIRKTGINYIKRSEIKDMSADIILLDTIGELRTIYSIADVCIIGGSFVHKGGHNLFEAAYWSKPIVCGNSMENFPLAEKFFQKKAAIKTDSKKLFSILEKILKNPSIASEIGARAFQIFKQHQGAVKKTYGLIKEIIK